MTRTEAARRIANLMVRRGYPSNEQTALAAMEEDRLAAQAFDARKWKWKCLWPMVQHEVENERRAREIARRFI